MVEYIRFSKAMDFLQRRVADKDSIQGEVEGASCPLTLEAEEVASIVLAGTDVARKAVKQEGEESKGTRHRRCGEAGASTSRWR